MDKFAGWVTLAFMITALAMIVSKRTQTAAVLTSLFNGIAGLQKAASTPL